jgi:alpha-methylacyl-CoA racemase
MPPFLDGIRVLDFATVGPAARCSRALADYGAQIVKLGAPGGINRQPPFHSYAGGRGTQKMGLDLKADAGVETFLRMAEQADVVIESFRPGVMKRLGVGYEAARARNPRIIYCSTSGYGQDGPYSQWAGHDINYLSMSGFLDCTTPRADGGPPLPGATMADIAAGGMQAAIAILAALVQRDRSGEGEYLDVSVADGALWCMSLWIDEHLATGEVPGPGHNILTGRFAWYDAYAAKDGGWLAVGAIEAQFFANLCKLLGLEQWIAHQLDEDRQDEMRADFRAAFATRTRDEWTELLAGANTCVTPVLSVPEVVADPHFAARGAFMTAHHPEHGDFRQLGPLLAGGERSVTEAELPSPSETDTTEVLRVSGFSASEIDELRVDGVVV